MSAAAGRRPIRSKTLATWIAAIGGGLGLHYFYLRGWRGWAGWLHPLPTIAGLVGAWRMDTYGQDDQLAWVLLPLLGLSLAAAFLAAIILGLTPDAKWARLYGRRQGQPEVPPEALDRDERTGWAPILSVILSLVIGATILMATIAFTGQRYYEYQALQQPAE